MKIQKQVNFLENHNEFIACCSNAYEKNGGVFRELNSKKDIIEFSDLANGNCIYTCTAIYRNVFKVPIWFNECKMGDWVIWLMLTQKGSIYNFTEPMAVYRMHNNGIWIGKGKERNLKDIIAAYNIFLREFDAKYKISLKAGAKQYYDQLLDLLAAKPSAETIAWTRKAFSEYYDVKQFRYLFRYFRNAVLPARSKTEITSNQSSVLP